MSNFFVDLPDVVSRSMKNHKMINWNEIISRELSLAVSEREIVEQILKKSNLKKKDVDEIAMRIKKSLYKLHYGKD